jgi:hypothetical protein
VAVPDPARRWQRQQEGDGGRAGGPPVLHASLHCSSL